MFLNAFRIVCRSYLHHFGVNIHDSSVNWTPIWCSHSCKNLHFFGVTITPRFCCVSINLSIKSSASCFSLAFCQLKIITLLCSCYKKAKIHIKIQKFASVSVSFHGRNQPFLVLCEQSSLMKLRLLWQVQLIVRFQYLLNRNVWFFSQFQCLKLLQME